MKADPDRQTMKPNRTQMMKADQASPNDESGPECALQSKLAS